MWPVDFEFARDLAIVWGLVYGEDPVRREFIKDLRAFYE